MEQWEAMMGGKTFITDLGEERHAEINGVDTCLLYTSDAADD